MRHLKLTEVKQLDQSHRAVYTSEMIGNQFWIKKKKNSVRIASCIPFIIQVITRSREFVIWGSITG